ncbi:MAG: lipopolysaccharide biosynthesis protein [Acidobacteria bacterium]|nr:lipopolysaccharide biosynthesis protein [Acidobacteriota bacterium]
MEPEDFGVFHAVNAYSSLLVQQVNFGMPGALLQARELEDSQWNSAFWVMEAIAALCTILVLFFSGWLSQFYADDRYTTIIRLSCVNLFIMPYMQINGSILRRSMDYKTVSHILMFSSFFSIGVSVTLAALGLGPYSLLISGIVSSFLSALLMKRKAPWQPQLAFNWEGLKPLVRFGWRLHLNKSLNMFATRVDNMMVGSIMGVGQLGYYNRAFNLSRMPVTELMGRLYQIFFTGLSRIQNNLEYSQKMLQKIVGTMCLAIFPFLIILILQGENVIVILYGEKWLPSAMPLKIMALGSFPYLIAVTLGSLSDAQNLVARETPIQVFNALATIVAVLIGSRWGLEGISWGIAVKSFLLLILLQQMIARSHVKLKFVRLIQAIIPAIIASMAGFAAGGTADYVLHHFYPGSAYLHISLVILAVFTTYGITIFTIARFKPDNEMLASNLKIFKEIFTKLRARLFGLFKSN